MKKFILELLKRSLPAAFGGPLILAIIYGIGHCHNQQIQR
jgi:hypothetical protein